VQLRVLTARFKKAVFKHKPVLRLTLTIDTGDDEFAPEKAANYKKKLHPLAGK
jgi:hypothetical protein